MLIFEKIITLIQANFIKGIFASILAIIFCEQIFKTRFNIRNAINILRWLMISYSILIFVQFVFLALLPSNSAAYFSSLHERATDSYNYVFWIVALGGISPFLLLFKKLENNLYLMLVIAFFMNIGWMMELLLIHISNIHAGYNSSVAGFNPYFPTVEELIIFIQGFLVGVFAIIIGNLPVFKQNAIY